MTARSWDEVTARATGRAHVLDDALDRHLHHRAVRAVAWAHELTADAIKYGPDERDYFDGLSHREAANQEWASATRRVLGWLLGGES